MSKTKVPDTDSQKRLQQLILLGFTLQELADMLDATYNQVVYWLHGGYELREESINRIKKLADDFNIDLDEINFKNKITKVIYKKKVDGKVLAMVRLNRYADVFAIGEGVENKDTVFDPKVHNAKVVLGLPEALKEWRAIAC